MSVWEKDNKTFCILPFSHLSPRANGDVKICSENLPFSGIPKTGTEDEMVVLEEGGEFQIPGVETFNILKGDTIADIWNSEFYKDIRRKMINGERVGLCGQCYLDDEVSRKQASEGIESKRFSVTYGQNLVQKYINQIKYANEHNGHLGEYVPERYEMRLSNVCNLGCRICSPKSSTILAKEFQNNKELLPGAPTNLIDGTFGPGQPQINDSEELLEEIIKSLPHLTYLELHGGEPTLHDGIWKVLDAAVKSGDSKHIFIEGHTNILKLEEWHIDLLNEFEHVKISFSIDAYGKENTYLRWPASWEVTEEKMKLVNRFNDATTHKRVLSVLNYWNAATFYKLVDWVDRINTEYSLGISHQTMQVTIGLHYRAELAPYELRLEGARKLREVIKLSNLCNEESPWHAKKYNKNFARTQKEYLIDTAKYLEYDYDIDKLNAEIEGIHSNKYDLKKLAGVTKVFDQIRNVSYKDVFPHMPDFDNIL